MPLSCAGVVCNEAFFAGKLLVVKGNEFSYAIGARTLELSGLKKIVSVNEKNIAGVWNNKNWQVKSWRGVEKHPFGFTLEES
jgi:hypothetical protein